MVSRVSLLDGVVILTQPHSCRSQSMPGSPSQSTPDSLLNPLSLYRLARKTVSDEGSHGNGNKTPRRNQRGPSPTDIGSMSVLSRLPLHSDPRDAPGESSWTSAPTQDLVHRPEATLDCAEAVSGASATPWQPLNETPGSGEATLDLLDLQNFLSWDLDEIMAMGNGEIEGNGQATSFGQFENGEY